MIKKNKIAIITISVLIVAFIALVLLNKSKNIITTNYDSFATCITDSGATMYGTAWCPHCKDQKKMFGSSINKIVFVDCDVSPVACNNAGITGYPTWVFGDGTNVSGTQSLATLASRTGCSLPN